MVAFWAVAYLEINKLLARFYATTEQKLIHSFSDALRICRKINQLHQSLCYTKNVHRLYTTLHKTILRFADIGSMIGFFVLSFLICF
jgi:hypothetical protein